MKVGYLGPKGTFSYEACNEYLNIHTSGTKAFQIKGDVFKAKFFHGFDDGFTLSHKLVKICFVDFNS